MIGNRNTLWSSLIWDELHAAGVRDVCVSPGSRSAPLAFALVERADLRATVHPDERSAGFVAVGLARASQRPVALVCTSGTAVANFHPAVIEAAQSALALIVLSADRPEALRGTGANQTIDQRRLFGPHAHFVDLGAVSNAPHDLRSLRDRVRGALAETDGPVHLNVPFDEPLDPRPVPGDVPSHVLGPATSQARPAGPMPSLDALRPLFLRRRGLLVAGPRLEAFDPQETVAWARRRGWPVLADPLSGLRSAGVSNVVATYDAFLGVDELWPALRPEVVVRLGGAPSSKNLLRFLADLHGVSQVAVNPLGYSWEAQRPGLQVLRSSVHGFLREANDPVPDPDASWSDAWSRLEGVARASLAKACVRGGFEGAAVRAFVDAVGPTTPLFVGNSLPVRDLDRFCPELPTRVYANRGASGIDGLVSSAVGVALHHGRAAAIVGDLSFLHDLSGLLTAVRLGVPLDLLVVDNRGGGIFEFLPSAQAGPGFERFLVAPHAHDVAALARAAGADVRRVGGATDLRDGLAIPSAGVRTFVYASDRKRNAAERRAAETAVHRAVRGLAEVDARAT